MTRTPKDVIEDIDSLQYCYLQWDATLNLDARSVMWEIINDIRDSYRLAMDAENLELVQQEAIEICVEDYIVNHYGDD